MSGGLMDASPGKQVAEGQQLIWNPASSNSKGVLFPGEHWLHRKEQAASAKETGQVGKRVGVKMSGLVSPKEPSQNSRKQRKGKRRGAQPRKQYVGKKTRRPVARTQMPHEACGKETSQIQK